MKPHPYADILPLLEGEPFDALVADIRANGLLEPIKIHEGMILDGRNRWNACKAAGVEPRFLEFDGDDPLAFVLSLNVRRRHLSESQRGMVVSKLEILKHGGDRKGGQDANLHLDRGTLASLLNVSTRTAASARAVRDHATPELIRAVEQDSIAVSVAAGLTTAPAAIQKRAVLDPARAHVLVKQERRAQRETELSARQLAWPAEIYGVIYADPPWPWTSYSQTTGMDRAPEYPTMTLAEIKAFDVPSIAAPDSVLFLWTTVPMEAHAHEVMKEWGFEYKSQVAWDKGEISNGFWFRNQHEVLLVGTKGNIPAPAPGTQWQSVIRVPVGRHSEKPEIFAKMIESYFPTLPKIELFARGEARPGCRTWGNEAA
jgi:N6-adenosine-specific RNA methylase IME4